MTFFHIWALAIILEPTLADTLVCPRAGPPSTRSFHKAFRISLVLKLVGDKVGTKDGFDFGLHVQQLR